MTPVAEPERYAAYGLRLCANRRIPGLLAGSDPAVAAGPDLVVRFREAARAAPTAPPELPWYRSDERAESGQQPGLTVWRRGGGACWEFRYADGATFVIDRAASRIDAAWQPPSTYRDVLPYFLGPIMGVLLRMRGLTCLHASAVAIDGRAVVFAGASEAGKTTTAAGLARLGFPVMTDDVAPLVKTASGWTVAPGYPRLRLRAASYAALAGVPSCLPIERFEGARHYLDLTRDGYRFQSSPLPLGAIYLLGERTAGPEAPRFSTVPAAAGLMALVGETFATRVLDGAMRAAEFETLSRVAALVPIRRVHPPADPSRLAELCEAIVADCAALWARA